MSIFLNCDVHIRSFIAFYACKRDVFKKDFIFSLRKEGFVVVENCYEAAFCSGGHGIKTLWTNSRFERQLPLTIVGSSYRTFQILCFNSLQGLQKAKQNSNVLKFIRKMHGNNHDRDFCERNSQTGTCRVSAVLKREQTSRRFQLRSFDACLH